MLLYIIKKEENLIEENKSNVIENNISKVFLIRNVI